MIKHPRDLIPNVSLLGELLRLARQRRDWVRWRYLDDEGVPQDRRRYQATISCATHLSALPLSGPDLFGLWGASLWLADGPKIFRPSAAQCEAMEQIEVRLTLDEYAQPYPCLLVDLPEGQYTPFVAALCHHDRDMLNVGLYSRGGHHDIVTTIARSPLPLEVGICRFDVDCEDVTGIATRVLRVAVNSCLALVSYGAQCQCMFPGEVRDAQRFASEDSDRGRRARDRMAMVPSLVSFAREVRLHHSEGGDHRVTGAGGEKSPHWRRGHWAMQAYGPGHSLRKRVLRPPVLVRKDLFVGDAADTITQYRS